MEKNLKRQMYNWITLPYTWNIDQWYFNWKSFFNNKKRQVWSLCPLSSPPPERNLTEYEALLPPTLDAVQMGTGGSKSVFSFRCKVCLLGESYRINIHAMTDLMQMLWFYFKTLKVISQVKLWDGLTEIRRKDRQKVTTLTVGGCRTFKNQRPLPRK